MDDLGVRAFDFRPRTRVVFGQGAFAQLGTLAQELGCVRTLLVADPGLVAVGYVAQATRGLHDAGVAVVPFHDFASNPDTAMIEAARQYAAGQAVDSLVALGGGSSLDCAKGVNFLLTQGGALADYQGFGKARRPMLPMIAVPTTAGTGSEAQCYALISDARTHVKMACGDPQAAFRLALLDPALTLSQPPAVTAATGYDAIAHAVETYVTTTRHPLSELFSREAWRLLDAHYARVLTHPDDVAARAAMQLGAYYGGVAIDLSMLGAAHACANPLTARYGTTHGLAISAMLPHVVRWNAAAVAARYAELLQIAGAPADRHPAEALASRLDRLAATGRLPTDLRALGAVRADLPGLAAEAARQWTGSFNPRPFDAAAARELYARAY